MKRFKILETMAAPDWFLKEGDIVAAIPEGVSPTMYEVVEIEVATTKPKAVQTATKKKRVTRKKKKESDEN